jgi:hypothetical protein
LVEFLLRLFTLEKFLAASWPMGALFFLEKPFFYALLRGQLDYGSFAAQKV